jgi:hypothetical protein
MRQDKTFVVQPSHLQSHILYWSVPGPDPEKDILKGLNIISHTTIYLFVKCIQLMIIVVTALVVW